MANTPQSYASKFRSLTPEKLAAIIVNEGDYHADAVTAARLELTARMLPTEELDRIYTRAEYQKEILGRKTGEQQNTEARESSIGQALESNFTKPSLWSKTIFLKLILYYLIFSTLLSLYNVATISLGNIVIIDNVYLRLAQLLEPTILLVLIALGLKGKKVTWWAILLYFSISLLTRIVNVIISVNHFEDSIEIDGVSIPTTSSLDDPIIAGIKLIATLLFFYLLLRKDTRVACGITKGKKVDMDELDHLI